MKHLSSLHASPVATSIALAACLVGCTSDVATGSRGARGEEDPHVGVISQALPLTDTFERDIRDACAARSNRIVGRVKPDAPDVYVLDTSAGDKIEIKVVGVYGFDPFVIVARGADLADGSYRKPVFNDDVGLSATDVGGDKRAGIARFDAVVVTTATESKTYVAITSSDAEARLLRGPRPRLPLGIAAWSYLGGAPELFRSAYTAEIKVNGVAMASAPRGPLAERSPKSPLALVKADASQAAADETACRDATIGDPIKPCTSGTTCKPEPCSLNYRYCCDSKRCERAFECAGGISLGGCSCCYGWDSLDPLTCIDCRSPDDVFSTYCPKG